MTENVNVLYKEEIQQFLLVLPDTVIEDLDLKDEKENPLTIVNENKMQLEWLSQNIMSLYTEVKAAIAVSSARLSKKKRVTTIILLSALVVWLGNKYIADLFRVNILYINLVSLTMGALSVLQILKYYALGFTHYGRDPEAEMRIIELKDLIRRQYSI